MLALTGSAPKVGGPGLPALQQYSPMSIISGACVEACMLQTRD